MAEKNEKEIKVKSLQKALDILNCFTKKSSWGVTELSEYLDLNKSNVHSILSTFAAMEYLRQDEETGKYRLGMAIYTLCHALGDCWKYRSSLYAGAFQLEWRACLSGSAP